MLATITLLQFKTQPASHAATNKLTHTPPEWYASVDRLGQLYMVATTQGPL
jgi:hypothetical protein